MTNPFNPFSPEHHARELLTEEIMVIKGRQDDPMHNRETLAKATLGELRELRDALLDEVA